MTIRDYFTIKITAPGEDRSSVPVHADGGWCDGTPLIGGRCPRCGLSPDAQSVALAPPRWRRAEDAVQAALHAALKAIGRVPLVKETRDEIAADTERRIRLMADAGELYPLGIHQAADLEGFAVTIAETTLVPPRPGFGFYIAPGVLVSIRPGSALAAAQDRAIRGEITDIP